MKLTITREALVTSLQMISGVVEKRQTMPVLANVLLDARDGKLVITGTNMEVELVAEISDVNIEHESRITVPAKKFTDICRALPEGAAIGIELKDGRLNVRYGSSHFILSTLPAEHFPNVEEEPESVKVMLPQRELKRLIDATAFAMAQQDVRYYLNGMLMELDEQGLRAVATDGHRLALANVSLQTGVSEKRQPIVPRKGILELGRLLSDTDESCTLVFGDNHVRASVGHFTFTSKLIDGKFPDYQRVIPRSGDKVMIADRVLLKGVLSRASILSHESIRGVRLQFEDGLLKVFANNPDQEEAEDSLEVVYPHEALQIGFNVGYLIDVLNALDDEQVKVTLSNANSSALVEGVDTRDAVYVVMPMRL
ncbi:DNA polymerase III subunit beta [Hahella sp. CR1]|uniref:DNA polymerase III subunit beta n=1 Tax=Hahella sp. CR1 TaxID=2992807 RepID=UPI00244292EC|nr:DNA polymerase III subunit beta [Hahella sp. CR1]MDG9666494.1 DNA polymerase III subunit beta [Hahella sp. CR1]